MRLTAQQLAMLSGCICVAAESGVVQLVPVTKKEEGRERKSKAVKWESSKTDQKKGKREKLIRSVTQSFIASVMQALVSKEGVGSDSDGGISIRDDSLDDASASVSACVFDA